jgi:Bacterial SH3 domain
MASSRGTSTASEFARLSESLARQSDPLDRATKSVLEQIRSAIDSPLARMARQMQEQSEQLRAAMDSPFARFAKQMNEDADRWRRTIASIDVGGSALAKAMESIASQAATFRFTPPLLQSFESPWAHVHKTLAESSTLLREMTKRDQSVIKQLTDLARAYDISPGLAQSGDLLASLQVATEAARSQLQQIASEGALAAGEATLSGIGLVTRGQSSSDKAPVGDAQIEAADWIKWFRELPPIAQLFLMFLLLHVITPIFDELVARTFLPEKHSETQVAVVTQVQNNFGDQWADGLRCVRTRLRVRESPAADSKVIGSLTEHQSVAVIETQGSWSKIRYFDEGSGFVTEGWAASGYLSKFKCQ